MAARRRRTPSPFIALAALSAVSASASDGRGGPPLSLTGLSACEEPTEPTSVTLEGPLVLTTPQSFSGLERLTVRGVTFSGIEGAALTVRDVGEVIIEGCLFQGIVGAGGGQAAIAGRGNGSVTLRDVTVEDVVGHGVKFPDTSADDAAARTGSLVLTGVTVRRVRRVGGVEGSANAIEIAGADDLTLTGATVEDVDDWGLKLGREASNVGQRLGEGGAVRIEGSDIHGVGADGILVTDGVYNVSIVGNRIWDIATDHVGARPHDGDHGIYYQANAHGLIEGNHIWNVLDYDDGDLSAPTGVGISYRSGELRIVANEIHDVARNGIAYYSDHVGSGTVTVESNLVYRTGRGGIYLAGAQGAGANPLRQEVDRHEIFANTVYMTATGAPWSNLAPLGWYTLSEPCEIDVAGNLLALDNGDADPAHALLDGASAPTTAVPFNDWPGQEGGVTLTQNLAPPFDAPVAQVFVDAPGGDLRLAALSPAIGFAPTLDGVVLTDARGAARTPPTDAGALEAP